MKLVPIEPGQWALAYVEHFGPDMWDGDLLKALERLVHSGSGWDCLRKPEHQFDVLQVERVMPKTFRAVDSRQRRYRNMVVASAGSAGEMLALRDKLFAIGFAVGVVYMNELVAQWGNIQAAVIGNLSVNDLDVVNLRVGEINILPGAVSADVMSDTLIKVADGSWDTMCEAEITNPNSRMPAISLRYTSLRNGSIGSVIRLLRTGGSGTVVLGQWNHYGDTVPGLTSPGAYIGDGPFWHVLADDYAEAGTFTYRVQMYPSYNFGYNTLNPRIRIELNKV